MIIHASCYNIKKQGGGAWGHGQSFIGKEGGGVLESKGCLVGFIG